MKKILFYLILFSLSLNCFSQTKFRNGIFLHHSTGANIWGPNGSSTSIPLEISKFNEKNGYLGINAVSIDEAWWPTDDNEWEHWHRIFENQDLADNNLNSILSNYKIIVIKSCFPSSSIASWGQKSDTTVPIYKSVYNYKWHWRHIILAMKKHPDNFFAIWTNAPLTVAASNSSEAALSKSFCKWAKDTLGKGIDPVIGVLPKNIYVFDFFSKLVDQYGFLQNQYAFNSVDSHPNSAATSLVAPQFVNEIFDAAINYENILTYIEKDFPEKISIFPNPGVENITITGPNLTSNCTIYIYNTFGQELIKQSFPSYKNIINISNLAKGIYLIKLFDGKSMMVNRFVKN
jgi:hypothetical protein